MEGDAVDLHEEGNQSAGDVELGVEGVQEAPDHLQTEQMLSLSNGIKTLSNVNALVMHTRLI